MPQVDAHGSHLIDAEQLVAHLRHSRRGVARMVAEVSYGAGHGGAPYRQAWRALVVAWCELFQVGRRTAEQQLQDLLFEAYEEAA